MAYQQPQYPSDQVLQVSIRNGLTFFKYYNNGQFNTIRSNTVLNTNLDDVSNDIKHVTITSQDNIIWDNTFIRSFDIESLSIIGGTVENLVELPPLIYLTLRDIALNDLPPLPFGLLHLNVSDNNITTVYTDDNNRVDTLAIDNNLLMNLTNLLEYLPELTTLSAIGNKISQISQDIGSLNGVDLSDNRLTYNSFYNDIGEAFIYNADEDLSGPDGNWYIFNDNPIYKFPEYLVDLNITSGEIEFTSQRDLTEDNVLHIVDDSANNNRMFVFIEDNTLILEFHDIGEFF